MRSLFLSEKRCISNMMEQKWGVGLESEPVVMKEYLSEPTNQTERLKFNCDFTLDFVEDFSVCNERDGTMNTALPNTLGADLYLFVETGTFKPLHFELMFGEAFSIEYFAPYIERVETAVRLAVLSQQTIGKRCQQALLRHVPPRKSRSIRILVVGGDICFLYFPSEGQPIIRGSRFDLAESDDLQITCYLDGEDIVCFDGWIGTEVARTEHVLVSFPKQGR